MNNKYPFNELVSKVTIDPNSKSFLAKDILLWVKDSVGKIITKPRKKIVSKKKQRV